MRKWSKAKEQPELLGKYLKTYDHSYVHFMDILVLNWASVVCFFAIVILEIIYWNTAPTWFVVMEFLVIIVAISIVSFDYYRVNVRPKITVYELGIEIAGNLHFYGLPKMKAEVLWEDIDKVMHPMPDKLEEPMAGFYLCFKSGEKVLIPQSIDKYLKLYSEFSRRNITGADAELPVYKLDHWGNVDGFSMKPIAKNKPIL
ncbi:hypothetical protein [Agaribacter flavus]|uniref:Uncharacterized protein n=1 Tax=Agaribacter flavus TaxID=1902781 RepID=A0ABV7FSJ6_9ALTE